MIMMMIENVRFPRRSRSFHFSSRAVELWKWKGCVEWSRWCGSNNTCLLVIDISPGNTTTCLQRDYRRRKFDLPPSKCVFPFGPNVLYFLWALEEISLKYKGKQRFQRKLHSDRSYRSQVVWSNAKVIECNRKPKCPRPSPIDLHDFVVIIRTMVISGGSPCPVIIVVLVIQWFILIVHQSYLQWKLQKNAPCYLTDKNKAIFHCREVVNGPQETIGSWKYHIPWSCNVILSKSLQCIVWFALFYPIV